MFDVRFSPAAREDLGRLLDVVLDRAETVDDLAAAEEAIGAIETMVHRQLAVTPYSFRKAGRRATRRELIIPFGSTGHVALHEIAGPTLVLVLAARHHREEDDH